MVWYCTTGDRSRLGMLRTCISDKFRLYTHSATQGSSRNSDGHSWLASRRTHQRVDALFLFRFNNGEALGQDQCKIIAIPEDLRQQGTQAVFKSDPYQNSSFFLPVRATLRAHIYKRIATSQCKTASKRYTWDRPIASTNNRR